MSKTIRVYKSIAGDKLYVTAYIGPGWDAAIQFTPEGGKNYSGLSSAQVKDLIKVLQKRLDREDGFKATEWGEGETILPDGSIEEVEADE